MGVKDTTLQCNSLKRAPNKDLDLLHASAAAANRAEAAVLLGGHCAS